MLQVIEQGLKRYACTAKNRFSAKDVSVFDDDAHADGERGWIRTSDPRLKRALLYQLSYAPTLLLI